MKKIILPFLLILLTKIVAAQVVNIPDSNFKSALISEQVDANGDGQIQVSEAEAVGMLSIFNKNIYDLTGIQAFKNLVSLDCKGNHLASINLNGIDNLSYLDIGGNPITVFNHSNFSSNKLETFYCSDNPVITDIDLSGFPLLRSYWGTGNAQLASLKLKNNPALLYIVASSNANLNSLDVTGCIALINLMCDNNSKINKIDLSTCSSLQGSALVCSFDSALAYINLKTGQPGAILPDAYNCPNLKYVCADDDDILTLLNHFTQNGIAGVNVNAYCSFTPGGIYNTISGVVRIDNNGNGCDSLDIPMANLKIKLNDTAQVYYTTTNANGNYNLYTYAGNFTVAPQLQNPYFTVTPQSANINFANANGTVKTQNFCIVKNGIYNDVEITIVPQGKAKPGFNTGYQLVYTNKGTETLSGNIDFHFDAVRWALLTAAPVPDSQQTGHLQWSYSNLKPFETRTIYLDATVAVPPVNNINDTLLFDAAITPLNGDATPADNSFTLQQIVVGALDPNDKTCLEGSSVNVSKIGDYVHYTIHFQNLGTDTAVNVVVKDILKDKFDWNSLQVTKASHPFTLRQSKGNQLEFIFDHINLPAKIQNAVASNGFVAFKIKSTSTLVAGDSLINDAAIYFDYNLPVVTAKAISKYVNTITVNLGSNISTCGGPVLLNAGNSGAHFLWNTGDTTQTLSVTASGNYFVKVTNPYGYSASDTIQVTINPAPAVNLGADIVQCGGSVILNAGNSGSTYLWNTGALAQTITVTASDTYFVKVTNTFGCSKTDTVLVTIKSLPVLTLNEPDSVSISAPALVLTGMPAGGTYTGPGVSNGTFVAGAAGTGSKTIVYSYTNGNGCSNTISKNIFVNAAAVGSATINIFPVINKGAFRISLGNELLNTTMAVYSASGLHMRTYILTATQQDFNLQFPDGVYYLRFKNKNLASVRKIIIIH